MKVCPQCHLFQDELAGLEKNVGVLDDASRRLSDTLGHELLFLKALSGGLASERRDLYPLLQTAVRDLLSLRFQEKNPRVEINGRPWEEARELTRSKKQSN